MTEQTDVFLTHDWGTDENGRNNHARVSVVNAALKRRGYATWFDEEKIVGDIVSKMCEGIDNTRVVIFFVTKRYMEKLMGENREDNCKKEFHYAARQHTSRYMIPVVMEKRMSRVAEWQGPLGFTLGGDLVIMMYFDFSDKTKFGEKIEDLSRNINMRLKMKGAVMPYIPKEAARPQPSVAPVTEEGEKTAPETSTAVCNQTIANLFHKGGEVVKGNTVEITLENAAGTSSSMFMLLGYLNWSGIQITDAVLDKLVELRREKNWTHVHPDFVYTLKHSMFADRNKLKNSADITSSTHSVRVVCDKVTTMFNFYTTSAMYSFKMRLPGQPACDNDQECGFLIEVTGVSRENPELDIQLVGDTNRYPTDIHLADKLHLALEVQYSNKWINYNIAWEGGPVYEDNGKVRWGGLHTWLAGDQYPARLVVYYSVRREQ